MGISAYRRELFREIDRSLQPTAQALEKWLAVTLCFPKSSHCFCNILGWGLRKEIRVNNFLNCLISFCNFLQSFIFDFWNGNSATHGLMLSHQQRNFNCLTLCKKGWTEKKACSVYPEFIEGSEHSESKSSLKQPSANFCKEIADGK